ncbi:hypothetical protein CEP51_016775 [Fusarium floridanum]|uniref:Uncharacterized protein n=1 Tax=Fusarium floridanum TaxID=1325733 RepID=A0A428NG24_9HYPO|nr:hypothetical protein CEP51_016775 [Fusarium floridanum]
MDPLPPLPDFEAVSRSYAVIAEEFTKVGNLPAISGGQEVQESVRRLEVQVRETARHQSEMLARIQGMLEESARESRVTRRNALVCSENCTVNRNDMALKPLYSYVTGQVIPRFPRTVAAIDRLSESVVDRYLDELGCETDGDAHEKKRRLKLACGVIRSAASFLLASQTI